MTNPLKIFSDFDGTISLVDTGDLIVDYCIGKQTRRDIDDQIVAGTLSFREGFTAQFAGVNLTWAEACDRLQFENGLDPTFKPFVVWTETVNIPLVVLSSGFKQFIEAYFKPAGLAHLEIRANQIHVQDRTWQIHFRDATPFGHDKTTSLYEAKAQGYHTIFIGDGISDIPAAQVADTLFAMKGERLAAHCEQVGISYYTFEDFSQILTIIKKDIYPNHIFTP